MSVMTNEEITAEFENLFASSPSDEEEPADKPEDQVSEEEKPEETVEESEQAEDESQDESDSQEETQPVEDKKQSKQNYAFAEQRLRIKKQDDFIKNIGKLIGMDGSSSLDEIQEKVKEALLAKEAKEQNIPVDILKRLERAESLIQENDQIKLEKKVTDSFTGLIEEHNLSKEDVDAFTQYLIDNNKNPMLDPNVDLEAEYLKLHYKDMVASAVQDALAKEQARQKKVEDSSASGVPKSVSDKGETKIDSVKALDELFASTDL